MRFKIMIRQYIQRFKEHPSLLRYSKNISWMFFTRLFTMGISFLTTLYIARTLGPTNFGELDYAFAIMGMFGIVATWGIDGVLNRELIKHPEDERVLVGTAHSLRIILGLFAMLLLIAFLLISSISYLSKILLLLLSSTFIINSFILLQQVFLAQAESKYPSLITMVVTLITNLTKVAILLSGKGVIYLALSVILESLLYSALYLISYKKILHKNFTWVFSPHYAKILLKTGTAVAFLGVFAMIYSRIDQIMIKHLLNATQVGLYSAGVRLVDIWGFVPTIIGAALYPALLNAKKASESLYYIRLQQLFLLYALPAFGIALVLYAFAEPLILLIYGSQFSGGSHALQIYGLSVPGTFVGLFVMNILFTHDYRKILVFTTAFPAIINIVLNLAWIPSYGIIGASWATTISYSLIPFIPLLFKESRRKLVPLLSRHVHEN